MCGREVGEEINESGHRYELSYLREQATAGKAGDALVFVRQTGEEWSRIQVSRSMKRLCAAKIAPPAVFHDLRRSYGSLLLNAGADAEVIQELLGHADLRMPRRAYAHLLNATVARPLKKGVLRL